MEPSFVDELKALEAYRLYGYVVTGADGWYSVCEAETIPPFIMWGGSSVHDDILWLRAWKVQGELRGVTVAEAEAYIEALPKWDKTKYMVKFADIGCAVVDCETEKGVTAADLPPDVLKVLEKAGVYYGPIQKGEQDAEEKGT